MTDSGVFCLVLLLYWISLNGPLSGLKVKHPDGFRGQIFSPVLENTNTQELETEIAARFKDKPAVKIEVDGVRCEFYDGGELVGWYAIRKSGYEAIIKCYYGSLNELDFNFLKELFEHRFGK